MSHASSPQPDGTQPPYRRLKLVMSTTEHENKLSDTTQQSDTVIKEELSRSSSPARPSYSPVTPTLSHSSVNAQDAAEPEWIEEPEPLPVSLDENPDAIALQATLSLLQMQRQQSLRDIRGLDRLRREALENPEAFVEDLKQGKLSKPASDGVNFDLDADESDQDSTSGQTDRSRFGSLPTSQNIARCPPIEWSKYHIVGEPLDRLHNLQRRHPGTSEEALSAGIRSQSHEVIAPYRPFTDNIDPLPSSTGTRRYDK